MNQRPLYDAEYRLLSDLPHQLWAGDALLLSIELRNTGTVPWLPFGDHAVRMSYHWRDAQGHIVVHDGLRGFLHSPVPPDARSNVELRVAAPPNAGTYQLQIDLLEEGVAWFSQRGVAPLTIPITFQPNTAPRACIVNGNVSINDAVGNHVAAQLQALRAAGYQTIMLTEFVDERLPVDLRRNIATVRLADLQTPADHNRAAIEHFWTSDVVIFNYSTSYELAQAITLVRSGITIFDYHGVTPPELWDRNALGYDDLVRGQQHVSLVQHADYAIAHSQYMRNELISTGLIPPGRVFVTPLGPGLEPRYVHAPDPDIVARYRLAGKRVLLYVGRMARNKHIHDLIEALALVHPTHPEAVLLLVGDNRLEPYRDYMIEVQARAVELGIQDHVIFTGPVPDVEPYYQLCDLFVTASVHEGFCIPVIEALAHGKPVVATAVTALPETVGDGGLLFEPEQPAHLAAQITRLLDDVAESSAPSISSPHTIPPDQTIAFVAPRYGADILGGAERLVRGWAEHLAAAGYHVAVLTTCVASMGDWRNVYDPGEEELNGVTIRRFPVDQVDQGAFHGVLVKANRGDVVTYRDERRFMQHNLQSSALNRYLHDHADQFACVLFAPYLFGTTFWAMQALPDKAIIIPCLHDEPSARFSMFREMLERAAGLFFNAPAECEFAVNDLKVVNPHRAVTGYGFDLDGPRGDGASFRERYNLPDQVLLYAGRLEVGKNVPLLLDYFVRYKNEHPGPLTLALTGSGDVPLPSRPDIVALGRLPEAEMPDAFAAALALCQPSLNESFSIVMMESWLQGRPVLVHADSAVTSGHVAASGGGYAFADYAAFSAALQRLSADPAHADELGQRGRAYVAQHYAWNVVTPQFVEHIAAFTHPRSLYQRLGQRGIVRALDFTPARFADALLDVVEHGLQSLGAPLSVQQRQSLAQLTQVGAANYTIRSGLPVVGRLIAWTRRQMTSHLKEPYLDPIVQRQETFNQQMLATMLPLLEQSLHAQRRLQREVELLREQIKQDEQ